MSRCSFFKDGLLIVVFSLFSSSMSHVYGDLKVEDAGSHATNLGNFIELIKLGYKILALNRTYCYKSKVELQAAGDPAKETKDRISRLRSGLEDEFGQEVMRPIRILSRSTIVADTVQDIGTMYKQPFYKNLIDGSDLVAYVPGNEKVCKMIIEKQYQCDIMALKMDEKMDFSLNHHAVRQAIQNKIIFELLYSPAIRSASVRKYIFRNAVELVEKAKGKGIIISSGGERKMDFRSPLDIINLGNLFSLSGSQCTDAISKNCHSALVHMETRKFTYKGAVMIEKVVDTEALVSDRLKRAHKFDAAFKNGKKKKKN